MAGGGMNREGASRGGGGERGEPSLQHEAKADVTPEPKSEPVAAVGQVLRNEPTAATSKGMHLGNGRPAIGGGSRRSRRGRAARERANGGRELDSALNLAGPRAKNLLIPVGLK